MGVKLSNAKDAHVAETNKASLLSRRHSIPVEDITIGGKRAVGTQH